MTDKMIKQDHIVDDGEVIASYRTHPYIVRDGKRVMGLLLGSPAQSRVEHIFTESSVVAIRDALTAWLDAPRLAARETPTVVVHDAVDDEIVMLLRTTVGEWCVRCVDSGTGHADEDWFATERDGRGHFADLRGKALCICGAECDADEIDRSGDEPQCPKCVAEAVAAFKAQWFRCPLCGWTGTGAVRIAHDGDADTCPGCDGFDFEEITP